VIILRKSAPFMATAMFHYIWDAQRAQAKDILASGKREAARLDSEIEAVLDRIMTASNASIIRRYEDKVEDLEKKKAIPVENLAKQVEPKDAYDEKLELALKFLTNPWKLWASGNVVVRRLVLKLALAGPLQYCRNEGARTPEISMPFKVLQGMQDKRVWNGDVGET
jgi:hypothetical protein